MTINYEMTHERRVKSTLTHDQLRDLLLNAVAAESGIVINQATQTYVVVTEGSQDGEVRYSVEVTIVDDMQPVR